MRQLQRTGTRILEDDPSDDRFKDGKVVGSPLYTSSIQSARIMRDIEVGYTSAVDKNTQATSVLGRLVHKIN
jgi:hypothetical protein